MDETQQMETPKKRIKITIEISPELANIIDAQLSRSAGLWESREEFLKDSLRLHLLNLRPEGGA